MRKYVCVDSFMHTYIHTHIYMFVWEYTCAYIGIYMCVCVCIYKQHMYTYIIYCCINNLVIYIYIYNGKVWNKFNNMKIKWDDKTQGLNWNILFAEIISIVKCFGFYNPQYGMLISKQNQEDWWIFKKFYFRW